MKRNMVSEEFHPGSSKDTRSMKHRNTPRVMRFHTPTKGADPRATRIQTIAALFILISLFLCLAMWLASLGAFTGAPMVIPGRLF